MISIDQPSLVGVSLGGDNSHATTIARVRSASVGDDSTTWLGHTVIP